MYEGAYEKGMREGSGTYKRASGMSVVCTFHNDEATVAYPAAAYDQYAGGELIRSFGMGDSCVKRNDSSTSRRGDSSDADRASAINFLQMAGQRSGKLPTHAEHKSEY